MKENKITMEENVKTTDEKELPALADAGTSADQIDEASELRVKLSDAEKRYMYLAADVENIRKMASKRMLDFEKYHEEALLRDLLEVIDDLDRDTSPSEEMKLIKSKFTNILEKHSVKPMYPDGNRPMMFSQDYDEAVMTTPTDDPSLDNSISAVINRGYMYKDKVLRYEKVAINKCSR